MNRFEYTEPSLWTNEAYLAKDKNVRLYDGDQKVSGNFENLICLFFFLFNGWYFA